MEKNSTMLKLSLLFSAITAFFYFIIGNGFYMLIISLVPAIMYLFTNRIKMDTDDAWWFIFIICSFISFFFADDFREPIRFVFVLLILLLLKLIYQNVLDWQIGISKIFFIYSLIHVIGILLSIILPDLVLSIVKKLYTGDTLLMYIQLFENGSYAGFAGQTAIAAYFVSIFLSFCAGRLFKGKRSVLNIVLLLLGIIALFATKKRSFVVANTIAIVLLFLFDNRHDKHKLKQLATFCAIVAGVILILEFSPQAQGLLDKINKLSDDDITNGRTALWSETIVIWKTSPIFGIGAGSIVYAHELTSHNVFLQFLAETGIVGVVSFIFLLISAFTASLKTYRSVLSDTMLSPLSKANYYACMYLQIVYIVYCFFGNHGISFMLPYMMSVAQMRAYSRSLKYRG